jgi:hypothetical protein
MHEHELIMAEIRGMRADIATLTERVDATKDVVEAWITVRNGAKFLKFIGSIGGIVTAAWLWVKAGFLHSIMR